MEDYKNSTLRLAVVQAAPIMFDKEKTTEKAIDLIRKAASKGAEMIVFPESFIPAYPYGMTFGFTIGARTAEGREDWKVYYDNSVVVPGRETDMIGKAAKEAGAYVSIGITERDSVNTSLYCTNLIFSPDGEIVAKHRKIKPTGAERYVWADGYEGYFPIAETPWGKAGTLICWENYMILARAALYEKGISIYLAPNTNDNPEWQDTMKHIAIESHCYVINADMFVTKDMYPATLKCQDEIAKIPETVIRGGSSIIDPYGHYVVEPLWDEEGILIADLDMEQVPKSRMEFDGVGHYVRRDILQLHVNEQEYGQIN